MTKPLAEMTAAEARSYRFAYNEALIENVLSARERLGLSQFDLACAAGLGHVTDVNRIENGIHAIRLDKLVKIARALGVDPVALLPPA